MRTIRQDRRDLDGNFGIQRGAVVLCIAVLVLMATVAASVAIADPAADGGTGALETLPSSKEALAEVTANAVPVAMPEPASPAIAPAELEDLGRPEAEGVLQEVFGSVVEGPAQALDELEIEEFRSDHVAVVAPPENSEQASAGLLSSLLPLRSENGEGKKELLDFDLERVDGDLQPENPLVPVQIPSELSEGIVFPGTGISIDVASVEGQRTSSLAGEASAFFPNVAADSDLVVVPTTLGAETFMQLRSADSPLTQVIRFNLPADLHLRSTNDGGAAIFDDVDGRVVLSVPPPSAADAEGQEVPAALEVLGDSIRVAVEPGAESRYPILVDPVFERYNYAGQTDVGCFCDWSQASNPGFTTEAWNSGSTQPGMTARAYQGATSSGSQATWQYNVPRYWEDLREGQPVPTSYIRDMKLWNLTYMMPMETAPATAYPFMQLGINSENSQNWVAFGYRDGTEGQATDMNWVYDLANPSEIVDAKHGGFAIATFSSFNNAPRYVNVQQASVEVTDKDSPAFGELGSVPSWVSSTAGPTINYKLTDPGLGVREVRVAYPAAGGGTGEAITPVKIPNSYTYNCTGAASTWCPRTITQARTPITYDPAQIAQGENWVRVYGVDPVGHWSSVGESRIKVDRTAPELELSGTLTEQAKVGTQQASYALSYTAKDGDEATATASSPIGTAGQLERPTGLAVDSSGNVWVVDRVNNRVLEFDKSGSLIRQIGGYGSLNGQMSDPRGIAVAPDGTIWVAEVGNKRIQHFSSTGAYLSKVTNASFVEPWGVAVNAEGILWVTDPAAHKVYRLKTDGTVLRVGEVNGNPTGIDLDSLGDPWLAVQGTNRVVELTPTGDFKFNFGSEGTEAGHFRAPVQVEVAPSGNIFVTDDLNNRVQEFKPDGGFMRQFGTEGSLNNQLKEPRGAAVGPGNILYIADAGNHRIDRWSHADRHVESGVVKAEVKVDGVAQQSQNPGCAAGKNCSLTGSWTMNADAFPVGKHKVEVLTTDGVGLTTAKTLEVETHGDLTAPSIALSGTMTEQSTLGSTRPTYKLKAVSTDTGGAEERKSGVVSATISLDGSVVDSYNAACPTGECSVTREWTLNSSNVSAGSHFVVVKATDGAGRTKTKEIVISINRDTVAPEMTISGPLWAAPKGWVEQSTHSVTAEATDVGGYGIRQLRFLIDGSLVGESLVQTCEAGGCSKAKTFWVDTSLYGGGAHEAVIIAEDGAGNIRKKIWKMNIDPDGPITATEAEATLEALDETSSINTVGPSAAEGEYEGTASELELEPREEVFIATGSAAPSELAQKEPGAIVIEIPTPPASVSCVSERAEGGPEEISGAEEEALATSAECQTPSFLGPSSSLESVELTPVDSKEGAQVLAEEGTAAVAPNFASGADLVTRPLFDGSQTFAAIREYSGPTSFSWQVNMEVEQELKLLDPQHAAVYYKGGPAAFSITATPAHDAVGTTVPTSLSVSGDVLTLNVSHHSGSFVYPVVGGAGWEGGFNTYQIAMPPSELPEGAEPSIEESELEALNRREGLYRDMQYGPPVFAGTDSSTGLPERRRGYNFHQCRWEVNGENPEFEGYTPPPRERELVREKCHDNNANDSFTIGWAVSVNGSYKYERGQWAQDSDGPECPKWGPREPAKIHCRATSNLKSAHLDVLGMFRFAPGKYEGGTYAPGQAECLEIDGVLPDWYRQDYAGEKVLQSHFYINREPVWPSEQCPWQHLPRAL